MRSKLVGVALASCWLVAAAFVQGPQNPQNPQDPQPIGQGPQWGGGQPDGANAVFATSDGCARCHRPAFNSNAMRSSLGEDVSPYTLWQSTVMANSFRDPYWRAQVAKECALDPEREEEIEALCLRCHAPMQHHTRVMGGQPFVSVKEAAKDPLAQDGVSCSVCHQIRARHLGEETTFSGKGRIGRGRVIYGPYEKPETGPMLGMARYVPKHGEHIRSSALCATCHTLLTSHQGERFPEQTPYFEWRNSVYSNEDQQTDESRTCQECHMAELDATRIARPPNGGDYLLPARSPYRGHAFVGGNAFLLDMLADNREQLGVKASEAGLHQMARATRHQLTTKTVDVEIGAIVHQDSELNFSVKVTNKTGHKFPTGYPARRAWLHVQVQNDNGVVFDSGGFLTDGTIEGVIDAQDLEHVTRIESSYDVLVWEMVAHDADGDASTSLTTMARRGKDNRLLPKGWRADGPHAKETAPVGVGDDSDFVAGSDSVDVAIPYAQNAPRATVFAWVHYQAIPPHWVEDLRDVDAEECATFVKMYDAADKTPETVGAAMRTEQL